MTLPVATFFKNEIKYIEKYHNLIKELKVGEITNIKALSKLILRTKSPINESFKELYKDKKATDMTLILRNKEEIQTH